MKQNFFDNLIATPQNRKLNYSLPITQLIFILSQKKPPI